MDDLVGLDWVGYFHTLSDDAIRELAAWLAAERLEVWELMDIVDRAYAQAAEDWHGRSLAFVTNCGLPVVEGYARRKRRFVELTEFTAALEEAHLCGALPGDVAPEELQPLRLSLTKPRSVEDLVGVLQRARGDSA